MFIVPDILNKCGLIKMNEQNLKEDENTKTVDNIVMRAEIRNIRNISDEYDSYLVLLVGDKSYPYMHIPDTMPDAILEVALRKLNA